MPSVVEEGVKEGAAEGLSRGEHVGRPVGGRAMQTKEEIGRERGRGPRSLSNSVAPAPTAAAGLANSTLQYAFGGRRQRIDERSEREKGKST